jgi:Mor family transcriptional regulator
LTDDDVRAMRSVKLPENVEARQKALEKMAKRYKISVGHLRAILRRKRWKHLD